MNEIYKMHELEAEIEHLEMVLESKDRKIEKLEKENENLKEQFHFLNVECSRLEKEIDKLNGIKVNNWLVKGYSKKQLEKEKNQALIDNAKKCAKAEAVKEFVERAGRKARKMQSSDFSGEFWDRAVLVEDIYNIKKEMVGEG